MMDEFYHFPMTGPYTREKLHVLLSVDAEKTDLKKWQYLRPDRDFGMVWIKTEGKGPRLQQRAGTPAGVLHDAGPGEADARRHPVRARRSPGRHHAECEAGRDNETKNEKRRTKNEKRKAKSEKRA